MGSNGRILLVDDDPMLLALMRRRLGDRGFDVVSCSDGTSAIAQVRDHPGDFDLVLMDVMMPGVDGIDALREIRGLFPAARLPVVMLTARDDQETTLRALRAGANDYVTKPPDLEILLARVAVQLQLADAQEALRASEERYSLAAEGSNDGLWDWQPDADRFTASTPWWSALGLTDPGTGSLNLWLRRVHPEDTSRVEEALSAHLLGKTPRLRVEHRLRTADDGWRWVLVRGTSRRDLTGRAVRMAGSITDLSEQRLHDPNTGLPLRDLLLDRVQASLERQGQDGNTSVLAVRLNGLEAVARAYGPALLEAAIAEAARRLREAPESVPGVLLRGAGHVTPAELALVVFCRREEDAVRLARRLDASLGAPVTVGGHAVRLRPTVGVAISHPSEAKDANTLLERATAASEQSDAGATSTPILYDPDRHSVACRRLELEADLATALRRGELHVEYQPVVQLPHGAVVGVEALARWTHPERGRIPPDEFVPIAEESGLIGTLGAFVLYTACAQAADWLAAGHPLDMAVNVSALEVTDPEWLPRLETVLAMSGLPPERLIIELTEGVFLDEPEAASVTLDAVRALGVRVSLDDFGTGFASLSYLRSLPFDTLKIDRSFVAGLPGDEDGRVLVEAVLEIARRFELDVVAEGVETQPQAALLASMGCGLAQGWHFGRPVPAADLIGLLSTPAEVQ